MSLSAAARTATLVGIFLALAAHFADARRPLQSYPTGGDGSCANYASDCTACLEAGCAWQPQTGGNCYSDCLIMDVSCYRGAPAVCPKSEELCAEQTTCRGCTAAGCYFQQGECRPECKYGPLGSFIAVCTADAVSCDASV
eukprot:jgi/Tetstr1/431218/TSEL_020930.t1